MFEYGIKSFTYGPGGVSASGAFTVYDPNQKQSEVLNIRIWSKPPEFMPWRRWVSAAPNQRPIASSIRGSELTRESFTEGIEQYAYMVHISDGLHYK